MNIPTIQFVVTGSKENFVVVHAFKNSGILFKILRKIFFPLNTEFFNAWNNHLELIMFFRSLREIEGKYLDDLLAVLVTMEKILLVAPLIQDPIIEDDRFLERVWRYNCSFFYFKNFFI
ncbi:hypothetical protein NC653_019153 [Populus alba x Populus x berolinensis]|uniref:Uncharacterized protein n=1 Tax=Populus alba x Populus x berolinensis TaxID=444605 RepID=A0AAD6QI41_9ROSI|nr:hypothetical protein NC653_019153 [Populus alba x Populus x berolinensis]